MRFALDVLAILTVVPKIQLQLAESVDVLDEAGSTVSTVGRLYLSTSLIAQLDLFLCVILALFVYLICNIRAESSSGGCLVPSKFCTLLYKGVMLVNSGFLSGTCAMMGHTHS